MTTDDALVRFEGSMGRVASVGDVDGDGSPDVITFSRSGKVRCFSVCDGRLIRTIWESSASKPRSQRISWDAFGDLDGDGITDLVVGLPRDDDHGPGSGTALAISTATGQVLHETHGSEAQDAHGSSVAGLGDVNGDGYGDYAVGARQIEWGKRLYEPGTGVIRQSNQPGYVEVFSGHTGEPLWRVGGLVEGHGFGARVRALGDLNADGFRDLVVTTVKFSTQPARILSGATGTTIGSFNRFHGEVGDAGDVDEDGVSDIFVDGKEIDSSVSRGGSRIFSGKTTELLFQRYFPDSISVYGCTSRLGDLDGDGFADLALGDGDFHLKGPGNPGFSGSSIDLKKLTLQKALELPTDPWSAFGSHSGSLWIVSGRSREVIMGIWGKPGSREGIGMQTAAVPDVSGDGWPDLVVSGDKWNYVLPGPGNRD